MLLSSCVIWRHRDWDEFRRECPAATSACSGSSGSDSMTRSRGSSRGARPSSGKKRAIRGPSASASSRAVLATALAGEVELGADGCADAAMILCTGGFAASSDLVTRYIAPAASLRLRASPWSEGDGLCHALDRGAALTAGMDEFYGRNMPDASWDETQLVSLSQLYGRFARIFDEDGVEFFSAGDVSWSETNVVQATARRRDAKAYYLLDGRRSSSRCASARSREIVEAAPPEARVALADLPFDPPPGHGRGGPRDRLDHPHDRRDPGRRAGAGAAGGRLGGRRSLGGGRRRGGRLDGRLCQRPRPGARARPRGRRGRGARWPENQFASSPPFVDLTWFRLRREPGFIPDGEDARRVSPGSGEAPILLTTSRRSPSSNSFPT